MKNLTIRIRIILIILFTALLFTACPDNGDISKDIIINNKSDQDIFVYVCNTQFFENCTGELSDEKIGKIVNKNSSERIHHLKFDGTMYLFILSMDVVNSNPWEEIVASKNYLKRYEFDGAKELDKISWTITYQ